MVQSDSYRWTVGLNPGVHDASAALLRNGQLVATAEEERFVRKKRAPWSPPLHSLQWCLDFAGIDLSQVDEVAIGYDYERLVAWQGTDGDRAALSRGLGSRDRLMPESQFGASSANVVPIAHHLAHAASAYYMSGPEDAAILVMDNRGEDCSTTLAVGTGNRIAVLDEVPVINSLGLFYRAACVYAGLHSGDGTAGKLMGLASYGRPKMDVGLRFADGRLNFALEELVEHPRWDLHKRRTAQLIDYFQRRCFPHSVGLVDDIFSYADFASSVQEALNDTVLQLASKLRQETGLSRLVIAGGVGLNCTTNGVLDGSGIFDEVFVQPMSSDAGVALGAALAVSAKSSQRPAEMTHAYWGPSFEATEIETALREQGVSPARCLAPTDVAARVAELLSQGKIVGWFQGRAEVGPRALGARSILGDPRHRETLVRLNHAKRREMWRPLAPSVLAERFHDFFEGTPNSFMIKAAQVKWSVRTQIPAVVHADGSARPQAVRDENPIYRAVIEAFAELTGIPLVVNTSFNGPGEPIVNTPREAVAAFQNLGLDALAIGPFVIEAV